MQLLYTTENDDGDLIVRYRLETEDGTVISGNVTDEHIYCVPQAERARLFLSVADPYGAASEIDVGLFLIDQENPEVTEAFNDKGYVLMGRNLYNRLTIMDDSGIRIRMNLQGQQNGCGVVFDGTGNRQYILQRKRYPGAQCGNMQKGRYGNTQYRRDYERRIPKLLCQYLSCGSKR